jgi:hypothetical protein
MPDKALQLTAGLCGFINVFWVVAGFGLSNVSWQTPAVLVRESDN